MISSEVGPDGLRDCFRDPIPEIFEAAILLDNAVTASLRGDDERAQKLIRAADIPAIGDWLDPIWSGHNNEIRAIRPIPGLPPVLPREDRFKPRDATRAMKRALIERDGFHCRLCGIPLVRPEVRKRLNALYPSALRWTGTRANQQHRGIQAMWLQFDHVVVHSRGGTTTLDNLIVTCPACNFGRDRYMMAEVGLRDPRIHQRAPTWSGWREWNGLERILPESLRIECNTSFGQSTSDGDFAVGRDKLRNGRNETSIDPSAGIHYARLNRVAENIQDNANASPSADRTLHLMSRVGELSKGLAADLRSGRIAPDDAAAILDRLAELGDLSLAKWHQLKP